MSRKNLFERTNSLCYYMESIREKSEVFIEWRNRIRMMRVVLPY